MAICLDRPCCTRDMSDSKKRPHEDGAYVQAPSSGEGLPVAKKMKHGEEPAKQTETAPLPLEVRLQPLFMRKYRV